MSLANCLWQYWLDGWVGVCACLIETFQSDKAVAKIDLKLSVFSVSSHKWLSYNVCVSNVYLLNTHYVCCI